MQTTRTFTHGGGHRVEKMLADVVDRVGGIVDSAVDPARVRSLVLFGGYGRGEGGVAVRNGEERPHNNLDFLLVTRQLDGARRDRLCALLSERLRPLAERFDVGLDLSTVDQRALRRAPCLVMWHDVRFGHHVVRGDPNFVAGLSRFSPDRIEPADMAHLVANRGTLLLLNEEWEARAALPDRAVPPGWVSKHAAKAVLGYGDALLFEAKRYHWSYVEKLRRISCGVDAPHGFRGLYRAAAKYRFRPDPHGADWARDTRSLLTRLEPIHRAFEAHRLGGGSMDWERDMERSCRSLATDDLGCSRRILGRARNVARSSRAPRGLSPTARLCWRAIGTRGLLTLLFPVVAYDVSGAARRVAAEALGAADDSRAALRAGYLRLWSEAGDQNFPRALRELLHSRREAS